MAGTTNSGSGNRGFSLDDGLGADELALTPDFGASGGANGSSDGDADGSGIDPVTGKRKRKPRSDAGKPRGPRGSNGNRGSSKAASAASVDALSRSIVMLSGFVAGLTNSPEFEYDKTDADSQAKATAELLSQFEIVPDPKTQAMINFAMITGGILGAKIYMRGERLKAEKEARKAALQHQ